VKLSGQFAILLDGTTDLSGIEQEGLSLRYVRNELNVQEEFVGFYASKSTKSADLYKMLQEILSGFKLDMSDIRAQTYDGAANMSGIHNGLQALVQNSNCLAVSFHCLSHVTNLVMEHCCSKDNMLRDILAAVNELGSLYNRSRQLRNSFSNKMTKMNAELVIL